MLGAGGPLYYAPDEVEGMVVSTLVHPGSFATIISFDQFHEIGRHVQIPAEELKWPDIVLHDYNQQLITVGAKVELTFRWKGKEVTTYTRAKGSKGELCLLGTYVIIPSGLMVPD